jgi:hypothetical protein
MFLTDSQEFPLKAARQQKQEKFLYRKNYLE